LTRMVCASGVRVPSLVYLCAHVLSMLLTSIPSLLICHICLLGLCVCAVYIPRTKGGDIGTNTNDCPSPPPTRRIYTSVSVARLGILVPTLTAILAVDFSLFPRVHAKTTLHPSLPSAMDLGTGYFVCARSLTSALTRHRALNSKVLVLVGVGVLRYLALSLISYHTPTHEYGTHWNFFLSMALYLGLYDVFGRHTITRLVAAGGLCLLGSVDRSHPLLLQPHLPPLLQHNWTGVSSALFGFFPFYTLGTYVLRPAVRLVQHPSRRAAVQCVCSAVACWVFSWVIGLGYGYHPRVWSVSMWGVVWGVSFLTLAETVGLEAWAARHTPTPHPLPPYLQAVDTHQSVLFMLSNLLVGGINWAMDCNALEGGVRQLAVIVGYLWVVVLGAEGLQWLARRKTHPQPVVKGQEDDDECLSYLSEGVAGRVGRVEVSQATEAIAAGVAE
ncbi:glucosaminyl-phosphotidylinositol O-acyltransferase, partial [Kipferlia bialata]